MMTVDIDHYMQFNVTPLFPQKFIPGQDVDVWIKFVEASALKLTLQMYPPDGKWSREGVRE